VVGLRPYLDDDHLANLGANSPQQGEDDGGPSIVPHQEPQGSRRSPIPRSKVKKKVQALIGQLAVLPRSTFMHKFGFIYLLEGDLDGVIPARPTHI